MNEYLNEIKPVGRAVTRAPTPVAAVQPVKTRDAVDDRQAAPIHPLVADAAIDEQTAGIAEYAKVHARIADILADMRSSASTISVDGAALAIQSMLPAPIILVPLPPASKEAVEHAAALAKRIAQQAPYARAAQAHVQRGTVDQILSTAA